MLLICCDHCFESEGLTSGAWRALGGGEGGREGCCAKLHSAVHTAIRSTVAISHFCARVLTLMRRKQHDWTVTQYQSKCLWPRGLLHPLILSYHQNNKDKNVKNNKYEWQKSDQCPCCHPLFSVVSNFTLEKHLRELPDRALVHFRRRMGEVVVVSASIEGEWGKRGTRAEHIGRHTVQRSGDAGFRARWLSWVVRHDVWKALYFTGWMMPRDGMVHAP